MIYRSVDRNAKRRGFAIAATSVPRDLHGTKQGGKRKNAPGRRVRFRRSENLWPWSAGRFVLNLFSRAFSVFAETSHRVAATGGKEAGDGEQEGEERGLLERIHDVVFVFVETTAWTGLAPSGSHERFGVSLVCKGMAATAHFSLRRHWHTLRRGKPGHRFQDHYLQARRSGRRAGALQRVLFYGAAVVCVLIGIVLSVIPGPAIPFFFLAGGLLATESRVIARFMDWCEVRLRNVAAWGKRRWKRLPLFARVILVILGVCCSAGTAYLSYRFMHR
jgi:hypothetical protein